MSAIVYLASVNTKPLAAATWGTDVLLSYAEFKQNPSKWPLFKALLGAGHWRSAVLDSGAFTELSQRKRGKVFTVTVEEYGAFALENAHLFKWIANLDDIEGDVEKSNRNFEYLSGLGLSVVPVYHEGESVEQLRRCARQAADGSRVLAIGCQRPKGKLVPTKVVAFLEWLRDEIMAKPGGPQYPSGRKGFYAGLTLHGFGLTRYADPDETPGLRAFPFDSVDSTTWIAEQSAVAKSGACPDRYHAQRAVVASHGYDVANFTFHADVAERFGGQAGTVARRLRRVVGEPSGRREKALEEDLGPGPGPQAQPGRDGGGGGPSSGGPLVPPDLGLAPLSLA